MPTVILLDVSLSMTKQIPEKSESYHQLAKKAIKQFLDYLSTQSKQLEFVSLVSLIFKKKIN